MSKINFLKIKKYIILIYFQAKITLKSNNFHNTKRAQVYDKEKKAFALTLIYHNLLFFFNYLVYIAMLHFSSKKKST